MALTTGGGDGCAGQRGQIIGRAVGYRRRPSTAAASQSRCSGTGGCRSAVGAIEHMRVGRHLIERQRVTLLTGLLSQTVAAAEMDRHPPAQVGQREGGAAVAAVSSAEQ